MKDFEKLFQEYSVETDETIINDEIEKILTQTTLNHNINTILYGCLDYTSLNCTDNEDHINKMVEHINNNIKTDVAAICVYPYFVNTVKTNLRKNGVNIAAVSGGFPSSQTFQEIKIAETNLCLLEGATEIDAVLPVGLFLDKQYEYISDEIHELKELCGDRKLKYILETGILNNPNEIKNASILALEFGADFIKTSTGKDKKGADKKSVFIMCQVIKLFNEKYNKRVGVKVAGGVNSIEEAKEYAKIVSAILGEDYLNKRTFRIGTSRLEKQLFELI